MKARKKKSNPNINVELFLRVQSNLTFKIFVLSKITSRIFPRQTVGGMALSTTVDIARSFSLQYQYITWIYSVEGAWERERNVSWMEGVWILETILGLMACSSQGGVSMQVQVGMTWHANVLIKHLIVVHACHIAPCNITSEKFMNTIPFGRGQNYSLFSVIYC